MGKNKAIFQRLNLSSSPTFPHPRKGTSTSAPQARNLGASLTPLCFTAQIPPITKTWGCVFQVLPASLLCLSCKTLSQGGQASSPGGLRQSISFPSNSVTSLQAALYPLATAVFRQSFSGFPLPSVKLWIPLQAFTGLPLSGSCLLLSLTAKPLTHFSPSSPPPSRKDAKSSTPLYSFRLDT